MTETFADWSALPNDCRDRFVALEDFIGDLDGREIEDGTVDADDAVKALNWLALELARLRAEAARLSELWVAETRENERLLGLPTEEEVAKAICCPLGCQLPRHGTILCDPASHKIGVARAVIAKFPKVQP